MTINNKQKFTAGDRVTFAPSHGLEHCPVMLVLGESRAFSLKNNDDSRKLMGIRCMWFTATGAYQEHVFHTYDLIAMPNTDLSNVKPKRQRIKAGGGNA